MSHESRIPLFGGSNNRMSCLRFHGLMHPMDLLIGASGSEHDRVFGWHCVSCGEIVDQVIVQNRMRARGRRFARREKRPRQPVRMTMHMD